MQAIRSKVSIFRAPLTRAISLNNGCLREIFKIQSVDGKNKLYPFNFVMSFKRKRYLFSFDFTDFKQKVDIGSKNKVIIVDFFATWCGPCKMLTPRIETVMGEHEGKANLAKVDIDEHSEIALDYDVSSVPVLVAIRDGKIQDRVVGLQDTDKLRTWVAKQVAKA